MSRRQPADNQDRRDTRLAWMLMLPALSAIALVGIAPIAWTVWESLHLHDLRMPWRGRPFVGADNYVEALSPKVKNYQTSPLASFDLRTAELG